jgi:signal transduction histidine kinase
VWRGWCSSLAEIRPEFTHHAGIVGRLGYLAPEQTGRTGRLVDHRADLYALGATLYEMATGEPPFGSGDPLRLVHDHLARVPLPPAEVNPAIPGLLSAIIMHLLEKEPDNQYKTANAQAQAELATSRARIVAVDDAARRRIQRNLHDGAQQRLVTLSLGLEEAQAAVPPGADELAQRLEGAMTEVADVLEELKEIARGLHPAVLTDNGLRPALRALVRRSAVPVSLDVQVKGRLPEPVEVAAYYAVAEALTNIAKYAGASAAEVEATTREGVLQVYVRDDGRGGADFGRGSGLAGLKDRIEALGGRISLHSPPAAGTTLQIALPLSGPSGPAWEG